MASDEVNNNCFLEDFESDSIIQWVLHKTQLLDGVENNGFVEGFENDSII